MKKTLIILIVPIFAAFTGCKDFLDTAPYSETAVQNFYKTSADVELAITGCYNILVAGTVQGTGTWATFANGMVCMLNGATDECVCRDGFSNAEMTPFGLASYLPDNELIRKNWFFLYAGINRVNYLLEKLEDTDMDETRKQEIKGEATFLRGLIYLYLGMMYGGVPLYIDSAMDPDTPRNSIEEVFTQVIADFKFAYATLPDRASIQGRANKWSAAGFLAKTYTWLASCKLYGNGASLDFPLNSFTWVDAAKMYQDAKTVTQDIINNSSYQLIPQYDYLFRESTASYQYQECLFTVESDGNAAAGSDHNVWVYHLIPGGNPSLHGGGQATYRPVAEMYYRYNARDKRRSQNVGGRVDATSKTETVDGVLYYVPNASAVTSMNYCINKFRYKDPKLKTINTAWSEGNFPLLRYADILLLHAEILNATGDEAEAREMLSQVRTRSVADGTDVSELNTAYHRDDFIQELLEERSRELCFEAWRRIDLLRFNKYAETINALSGDQKFGRWNTTVPLIQENWEPYKTWFPIPATQIDLNPALAQNPGYN